LEQGKKISKIRGQEWQSLYEPEDWRKKKSSANENRLLISSGRGSHRFYYLWYFSLKHVEKEGFMVESRLRGHWDQKKVEEPTCAVREK